MKCHYIHDKIAGKVLIPGCMSGAVHGIDFCVCQENISFARFEKERYNETVKELQETIREQKEYINHLNQLK